MSLPIRRTRRNCSPNNYSENDETIARKSGYENDRSGAALLRVGIGLLMLTHGTPRLALLVGDEPIEFPPVLFLSAGMSLFVNVFAEFFCSLFVIIGLGTRITVIPLMVVMAVAGFHIHLRDQFRIQEMSLHFLLVYVVLFVMGSGRYSVDSWLSPNKINDRNLETKKAVAV
ncbi:DoxX family protein [Larkinella humicola]|uniref:DoxX family protein n=1 Tax=Larkinella humicola TaxID=2607654 RepID=A0A5N1J9B6_9BACT|nr:DoxX family protein [Larkinella humicola]KAA9349242.1 DoxX family protein [Larkinella humicola]